MKMNAKMKITMAVSCCMCETVLLAVDKQMTMETSLLMPGTVPLFRTTTCDPCMKKILKIGGYTIAHNVMVGVMLAINSPGYKRVASHFGVNPRIGSEHNHVIEPLYMVLDSLMDGYMFMIMTDDIDMPTQMYKSGFF